MQLQSRLQDSSSLRTAALVLLAIGVGVGGGLLVVAGGSPIVPFVALAALVALPWLATRPIADLLLVEATILLLPFAVLPVRLAVLTPTLLEVGLLFLYATWLLRALQSPGERLARTPLDGWLILFLAATLFALLLGIWRDPSTDVMHNYLKLLLAVGVFFAAGIVVRSWHQRSTLLRGLLLLGGSQALLGALLWALPDERATGLLTRLSVIGYPTDRVVRYVEDNPALGERAVGTQVDPNSFGGMLVVLALLTGVQLLARKPVLPRWLLGGIFLAEVGVLFMTGSRTAFLGLLGGMVLVATLRYRRLWAWGLAAAVPVVLLGVGSGYLGRLAAGLRFEDQANQMRLAEYQNALDIISRYPAFGVGFGTAGELNLTTGVSSVYLTVAERTGLLGLGLYLALLVVFFAVAIPAVVRSRKHAPPPGADGEQAWSVLDSALLGGVAAIFGAAVVGISDHYYFNIEFPHMVALFWLVASLTFVALRLQAETVRGAESSVQRSWREDPHSLPASTKEKGVLLR